MINSCSVADWRSNISPQMFSKSLKIELRAAYVDYNHCYFLKERYLKENVYSN